jgi:hypothetical protein
LFLKVFWPNWSFIKSIPALRRRLHRLQDFSVRPLQDGALTVILASVARNLGPMLRFFKYFC